MLKLQQIEKYKHFYQTIEPIAEDEGDLWVHTGEGNKLYRWDGNDWTPVQDEDIQALVIAGDAQAIADGKITTYLSRYSTKFYI